MTENRNESAFPITKTDDKAHRSDQYWPNVYSTGGLTKREYFAAMAMQGIVNACWQSRGQFEVPSEERIAEYATEQADALLNQLNQPHEQNAKR